MNMKKYEDASPTLRAFMGNWEGFRRMGFPSENLYLMTSASIELGGALGAYLVLRRRGREFSVFCGEVRSEEAVETEYRAMCEAVVDGTFDQEDLDRIWQESVVYARAGELIAALLHKGIDIPDREAS
jgi:hypothetical protein